jgi:outer membrane protein
MKKRLITSLAALVILGTSLAPAAIAADLTDVGFLDQAALANLPVFVSANAQLQQFQAQLQGQLQAALRGARSDADKQRISMQFQQEFTDKQRELVGPLFARAQGAIAQVASARKLSVVVDKRIVIYGGTDITSDVINAVRSSQAMTSPQSSPPPSAIGFVDETALDSASSVKSANDSLTKFEQDQQPVYAQRAKDAKSDIEKQQIAADFQKTVQAKQDELLKPLVEQTKADTARVAQSKGLLLVIDRADIVYGGTDITQDVQDALNK